MEGTGRQTKRAVECISWPLPLCFFAQNLRVRGLIAKKQPLLLLLMGDAILHAPAATFDRSRFPAHRSKRVRHMKND